MPYKSKLEKPHIKGHDLGKAASVLLKRRRDEAEEDRDGRAFGAPMGEIYAMPSYRQAHIDELRQIKRRIKAITGLKFKEFEKEMYRRTLGSKGRQFVFYSITLPLD